MDSLSSDLDDLATSDWGHGAAWDAKVTRARQRIADLHAMPPERQLEHLRRACDGTCQIPEVRRLALRPLD